MNYERLYEYRFQDVGQQSKQAVWNEIAAHLYLRLGSPQRVLEPGAGRCEFINAVPAAERWVIDQVDYGERYRQPGIRFVKGDVLETPLPESYFDGILVSNFLEHLPTHQDISLFLDKMFECLKPGGRIAIMGPNFRYCAREYFDCADHTLALTHMAIAEHVYACGFEVEEVVPKFLPFSFRGRLPPSPKMARLYLKMPLLWSVFGKQFLVCARKNAIPVKGNA